ncbi:MAG: hypothetical protein HKN59_01475 [Gammaproteobacteria bacterium]|nr:hypothetical protein [Gammaproteobacteria bacterium]
MHVENESSRHLDDRRRLDQIRDEIARSAGVRLEGARGQCADLERELLREGLRKA